MYINVYVKIVRQYKNPEKHIKASGFFPIEMLTSPLIVANCVLLRDFRYSLKVLFLQSSNSLHKGSKLLPWGNWGSVVAQNAKGDPLCTITR